MSGGTRPQIQAASREEPREAGFYVRPVGFDVDMEVGGRAACRIARVKTDQILDEGSGVQYEQVKIEEELPELLSESEDEDEDRRTTRGQAARKMKEDKRRSAEMLESDTTAVQLAEGLTASYEKKPRMDKE